MLQGIFILICSTVTYFSIKMVRKEQALKIKYGRGIIDSDLRLEGKNLFKLVIFAFLGGWVSGALGLGGGAIFNPLLLSMGVPPSVSSATGMYMIMYSTAASSSIFIMYKMLDFNFGFWIGVWCCVGTIVGLKIMNSLMKRFDRQSPIVMVLTFILLLSAVFVPFFGSIELKN
jgi:uncharacterized membrane protein YfcA